MRQTLQRFSPRRFIGPMLLTGVMFYLAFHALNGDRGIYALLKEQRKLEVLHEELTAVSARRETLERRVRLLSPHSLDLDMLDEQARGRLGYMSPDEQVILK